MDGRDDDRVAALERQVEALSKGSGGAWWKDKVLVAVLGMVLPATALAIQRLDARSKESLDKARQASERQLALNRYYAEREAFAIKTVVDAKKPEEKTLALEILTVLAPPVDDDAAADGDDHHPQWGLLLAKLSEQLGKALQKGEFHDEADVDRALEATNQAAQALETRIARQPPKARPEPKPDEHAGTTTTTPPPPTQQAPSVALIRLKRAAQMLSDKAIRQKAFATQEKPANERVPVRPAPRPSP